MPEAEYSVIGRRLPAKADTTEVAMGRNSSGIFTWTILMATFSVCLLTHAQEDHGVDLALQKKIMNLERQGWEAAKNRDSAAAQRLLTDDALDVGEYGIWDAKKSAESIASLEKHPDSTLADYSISDLSFRRASQDVVVIAYKVTLASVSNNIRQTPTVQYYSAVWVRQGSA